MQDFSEQSTESSTPELDAQSDPVTPRFFLRVRKPTATRVLIGLNLIIFVGMIIYGWMAFGDWNGTENLNVLVAFGAKVNDLIVAGQPWRLLTAMFLHIGVLHLLFNLYALNALGPMVEGYFGHARFLAIYFISGLFGSVASFAFSPAISAGASGAIFGLAGATTVYFLRYRDNFGARGRAILQNMVVVIAINMVFGLSVRGIDNWGHFGGLVGGAIVAWGLLPRYQRPEVIRLGAQPLEEESRTFVELVWTAVTVALLLFFFQWASANTPLLTG